MTIPIITGYEKYVMKKILLLLVVSCTTTELSSSGANVQVVVSIDDKNCKNLGPVQTLKGIGWGSNVDTPLILLRNKAGEMGATHLFIFKASLSTSGSVGSSYNSIAGITPSTTSSIPMIHQQGIAYSCPKL